MPATVEVPPLFVIVSMLWAVAMFGLYDLPRGNVWRWLGRSAAPLYVVVLYLIVQAYHWPPSDISAFGRIGFITLGLSWGGDVLLAFLVRRGWLRWTRLSIFT